MQTIYYWRGAVGASGFMKEHEAAIKKLLQGEYAAGDLEKLVGHEAIYSYRLNIRERLLFTTLKVGDASYLLVLEHLPHHDYQKSRFLRSGVLKHYVEKEAVGLARAAEQGFEPFNGAIECLQAQAEDGIQPIKVDYYHRQFIQLNLEQQDALALSLPAVISGAAGSGKSCIAVLLLAEFLSSGQQMQKEMELPILYVTQSKPLVDTMQGHWNELPIAKDFPPGLVQFKTYEALLAEYNDLQNFKVVGQDHFEVWYSNYVKHDQLLKRVKSSEEKMEAPNSKDVYQEFRICAFYPEATYQTLGKRQSLFPKEQRSWLFDALKAYQDYLYQNQRIDPALHKIGAEARYDLIVVDESQDLSYLQLNELLLLAKDRSIAYCMDSHQSLSDSRSQRPFLLDLLRQDSKDASHIQLGITYRCPLKVVQAANAVIQIKHRLTGGIADKKEATAILPNIGEQVGLGHVLVMNEENLESWSWLQAKLQGTSVAVVTSPKFLEQARQRFKTPLVMTVDQIKGLEYDIVIAYRIYPEAMFKEAYALLQEEEGPTSVQPLHRAKAGVGQERFGPYFNQIFTAYTRAKQTLLICEAPSREASILLTPLKEMMGADRCIDVERNFSSITSKDWLQEVREQMDHGNETLALTIYLAKINPEEEAFKAWKATYQVDIDRPNLQPRAKVDDEVPQTKQRLPFFERKKEIHSGPTVDGVIELNQGTSNTIVASSVHDGSKVMSQLQMTPEQELRILTKVLENFSEKRLITALKLIGVKRCLFDIEIESIEGNKATLIFHILHATEKLQILENSIVFFELLWIKDNIEPILKAFQEQDKLGRITDIQKILIFGWLTLLNPSLLKSSRYLKEWFDSALYVDHPELEQATFLHWLVIHANHCSKLFHAFPHILKDVPIASWGLMIKKLTVDLPLIAYVVTIPGGSKMIARVIDDCPRVIEAFPHIWGIKFQTGVTLLHWLTVDFKCIDETLERLIVRYPDIVKQIPIDAWISISSIPDIMGGSPNALHSIAEQGSQGARIIQLLIQYTPSVIQKIPFFAWEMLFKRYYHASVLYWLCSSTKGQLVLKMLIEKFPDVIKGISAQAWGAPRIEGARELVNVTPLYLLTTTQVGNQILQYMIEELPEVMNAIPSEAWGIPLTKASGMAADTTPLSGLIHIKGGLDTLILLIKKCPKVVLAMPAAAWDLPNKAYRTPKEQLLKTSKGLRILKEIERLQKTDIDKKNLEHHDVDSTEKPDLSHPKKEEEPNSSLKEMRI